MQRRRLGKTGLEVSALGLGCMAMTSLYGPVDEAEAIATVREALDAGADFLKTSSGKVGPGASLDAVEVLLEVVLAVGHGGVKASGGIRTAEQAAEYLALADRMMGPGWVAPERFRFGASGLVDDLVARPA